MSSDQPFRQFPVHAPRPDGAPPPIEGVRVIDFTRYLAGPWCTQTLADMGAEVVKVEAVEGGDETRSFRPPEIDGEAPYFLGLNRGKKSFALNLASEGGARIVRDLVRRADVVVENFSPGVMTRLGLDHSALSAINPDLIYCAITAYGSDSSCADQPGFDSVFQAESGFMSLTGDPGGPPMRTGSPVIDIAAAMNATSAVLAALYARARGRGGQRVEVAMFDTAITLLGYQPMNYLANGVDPVRQGNEAPVATPIGLFETAEGGPVYVSCGSQRSWRMLAEGVLERPDLVADPKFADNRARNRNRAELHGLIAGIFLTAPRDRWMERARAARVPIGAVRTVGEALNAPLAQERRMVTRVARPDGAEVPNIAAPFRFSATPAADPVPAPRLDADRDGILFGLLGYDAARIAEAEGQGAFSTRRKEERTA